MLALRDQENLVHGHQAAAASKSLNHGVKQLPPKTPGNKAPKTPFKVPLNDENDFNTFGGNQNGLKTNGRGNENFLTGGKKKGLTDRNAYVTPLGPRNRAPLGLKTNNAKAKVLQTPAPLPLENEVKKGDPKTGSARKPKPKASPAKMTKIEVLGDMNELEEDIEYMPPPVQDMPDYPDDMPHSLNLSMFEGGALKPGFLHHFATRVGDDGLTFYERQERKRQKANDLADKMNEALFLRDFESVNIPCVHLEECLGECTASIENKKTAEGKYQKTIAALSAVTEQSKAVSKSPIRSKGPATITSKSAAAVLSQPKRTALPASKPRPSSKPTPVSAKPTALLPRSKKPLQPTNPSTMRHNAASATSKTTIGHSKGRATSAALRRTGLSSKDPTKPAETPDTTLAPDVYIKRYGVPTIGSQQWIRCQRAGCFDHDDAGLESSAGDGLDGFLREEAEREFRLEL